MIRLWILLCLVLLFVPFWDNKGDSLNIALSAHSRGHGDKPVDFTLLDSANRPVSLRQYRGKFVVICMVADWCGPCHKEIAPLREMQANLLGQNIVWIFISFDRDRGSWDDARRDHNYTGIELWGKPKAEELKNTFSFDSLPYYIWIDRNGVVVADDAPRPSSRSAMKQIRLYLND